MTDFDSIIFDLDGTLWNSSETVAVAWTKALKGNGIEMTVTGADVLKHMGKPMDVIMRDVFGSDLSPEQVEKFLKILSDEEVKEIEEKGGILFPKLEETLVYLKTKYRLFIVSNCQKGYIEAFLKAHKLGEFFEGFLCWGDTLLAKGETNKKLIADYNLEKPVYVGDTEGDHISAIDAEIPFVYASYGFGEVSGCEYRLEAFSDMKTIFG